MQPKKRKRPPPPHVTRVRVMGCRSVTCKGDDGGCNASWCKGAGWTWMYHDDFVERFGRCPVSCQPGGAKVRETLFDVWVVEAAARRIPTLKLYQALRVNRTSVTVVDHGRTTVIKAAAGRMWFTEKDKAKAHLREEYEQLRKVLEEELAEVKEALAGDTFPLTKVPHERPALWDAPLSVGALDDPPADQPK